MAMRRIFKDKPKMSHYCQFYSLYFATLLCLCKFPAKKQNGCHFIHSLLTRFINFWLLPLPKTQEGTWGLMISGKSWQELLSFKWHITLKGTTMIRSKCHWDKNIQAISPRKLFHHTMYQTCCIESQPQSTYNAHLQNWNHLKLLPVK